MASKLLRTLASRIKDDRQLFHMADELKENGAHFEEVEYSIHIIIDSYIIDSYILRGGFPG